MAKRSTAADAMAARVDALLLAGVLHPDRPLVARYAPRPAPAPAPVSRRRPTPPPAPPVPPVPDVEPVPVRGRTLRQQLASANHRVRYWTRRAKMLEAMLERHGLVPPPARIVDVARKTAP